MTAEPIPRRVSEPAGWERPGRGRRTQVRFTDGSWRTATVLCWRHRQDDWYAFLRWDAGGCEWLAYDPRHIRPG